MTGPQQFPSETADRFVVRLPDGLRDEIRTAAQRAGRSMNAEIIHRISHEEPIAKRLDVAAKIFGGMTSNPAHDETPWSVMAESALLAADTLIAFERASRP